MSETTQHEVEVQFTAKDLTTRVIGRINKAAGQLSNKVDGITSRVASFAGTFGGLGAVFGFGGSVMGANRYLASIEEIATITNQSANNVAGMQHAMEQSGLAGEETRAIMLSISRKQAEITGGSAEMAKMAKRYGVELKKGPQEALISMAASMKAGKMQSGDVIKMLEESGAKAIDLLRKGPLEVQRLIAEGAKKNSHINETSIAQYKQMDIQMTKVKQAWTRITTKILIKLAPALTKMMRFIELRIDSWAEGAERFGDFLVTHMDAAVTSAKVLGKVLMANYLLMKLTGEGLVGNSIKMMKFAKGPAAAAGASKSGAAADVASSAMMMGGGGRRGPRISGRKPPKVKVGKGAKVFGRIFKRMPKMGLSLLLVFKRIGGIGGKLGKIFAKVSKIAFRIGRVFAKIGTAMAGVGRIALVLLKLSVIGVVITSVVSGIKQIISNVDGIRDKLGVMLKDIWADIKSIGETIAPIFGPGSFLRTFFDYLGSGFVSVIKGILGLIKKITHAAAVAAVVITEKVGIDAAEGILRERSSRRAMKAAEAAGRIQDKLLAVHKAGIPVTLKHIEMMKEMQSLYAKTNISAERQANSKKKFESYFKIAKTPEGRPQTNYDFRGSRFDIMQNFAEGFDPDRIAVAFTNDLGALGERRLQSGLAPAFSAR